MHLSLGPGSRAAVPVQVAINRPGPVCISGLSIVYAIGDKGSDSQQVQRLDAGRLFVRVIDGQDR